MTWRNYALPYFYSTPTGSTLISLAPTKSRSSTINVGRRIVLYTVHTSYVRPEPVLSADNASEDDGVSGGKAGSHDCHLYRRAVIQLPSGTRTRYVLSTLIICRLYALGTSAVLALTWLSPRWTVSYTNTRHRLHTMGKAMPCPALTS